MSRDEDTCQGSVGRDAREVLEDKPKKCCACGKVMTREELRHHPLLCDKCSVDVDREYEARKEDFGWFE
jgi:acetyl-CoA carboxylase beta subunit